ncbi:nuclear transport factor 2 family protein [Tellurirhabdus rosea]|uniref:nuclear transport factor 2 family protein n=1 Tax=Tellurirhabdus rosea TaxID=2674997 RepID=UPI0022587CE5|nr:nuclear transport factor 2 family protein [Tellurirhabdus rosea]
MKTLTLFLSVLFLSFAAAAQDAPEKVVQKQLDAYNAQNVDAFVATYADSVVLYQWPNKVMLSGKQALRQQYAGYFKNNPENYAALVGRIVQGNFVIDREKVTGKGYEVYATAVYEVRNGLITKVWFIR